MRLWTRELYACGVKPGDAGGGSVGVSLPRRAPLLIAQPADAGGGGAGRRLPCLAPL